MKINEEILFLRFLLFANSRFVLTREQLKSSSTQLMPQSQIKKKSLLITNFVFF